MTQQIINNQIKNYNVNARLKKQTKKKQIYEYTRHCVSESNVFLFELPEVCARTYKLFGACSCVLSFKAEFFLRNKKQLIWTLNKRHYSQTLCKLPNSIFELIACTWSTEKKTNRSQDLINRIRSNCSTTNCVDVTICTRKKN